MAKKITITKEEDTSWERHLFAETSPEYKGLTFIGVEAIGYRLEVVLNQEELAEFISELQTFLNPKSNG